MDLSCTKMLKFVLFLSLAKYIDLQKLTSCQVPEKNTYCVLKCKTRDFNEPVTFRRRTKDVGSCNSQNKHNCSSYFNFYNLSQSRLNGFITRFHIAKLDRQRDEGDWSCSYGNLASKTINLTVHSRPRTIDIKTKPKTLTVLEIECICSCLYPVHSVEFQIEITSQDKSHGIERSLPITQFNSSTSRCAKEEKILFGVVEIDKDYWQGRTIDIGCFCKDTVTRHTTKKKITHVFEEIDNSTNVNNTIPTNINNTIPIYLKVVIPLICCGFGFILFTGLIYYCILFKFKRMSKRDEYLCRELKYFKRNLKAYRIHNGVIYVLFWIIVVACSYAVAFNLHISDNSTSKYVTKITCISLFLGILPAVLSNALLWRIFIIKFVSVKRNERKDEDENIELLSGHSTQMANSTIFIQRRVGDGTFVKTKGFQEGLDKSLQHGAVIYTGALGEGRTTNAYHVVTNYEHTPIILSDIKRWTQIVNLNENFVVLIEGIVSKVIESKLTDEEIKMYFDMMMMYVKNGKTKIIMTEQTKTMYEHRLQFQHIELFEQKFRVDLCQMEYKLTKEEKERILRNHCEVNNIEICEAKDDENILERKKLDVPVEKSKDMDQKHGRKVKGRMENQQETDKEEIIEIEKQSLICGKQVPVRISKSTVDEIIETEPLLGFPESCSLFCKNEKYRKLGLEFFLQPFEAIINGIEYLFFSQDEEHLLQSEVLRTLFQKKGKIKFSEKKYKPALHALNGIYITQDEDNECIFIHHSVYVAVGLAIGKLDPKAVIEQCDWNFLLQYTKVEGDLYDENVTYHHITPDHYESVKSKFLHNLSTGSVNRYFHYISKLGEDFLCKTLNEVKKDIKLDKIVKESCIKERGVFVYACKEKNRTLIKELFNRYKDYIPEMMLQNIPEKISLTKALNWLGDHADKHA